MKTNEAIIKLLEEQGYTIKKPESETVVIDGTEYELKQHDNGKILSDIKMPKGWRLLKAWEAMRLWDLNLFRDGWIFVENPLKNNLVARFVAISDRAYLFCGRDPADSDAELGVIFARDLKSKEKK